MDSLIIRVEAESKHYDKYFKDIKLDLDKSIVSAPKYFKEDNQKIEKIFVSSEKGNIPPELLKSIKQSGLYSKSIVIEHFGADENAEKISNLLKNEIKDMKIIVKQIEYINTLPFSINLAKKFMIINIIKI
jgi:hypothetical protein